MRTPNPALLPRSPARQLWMCALGIRSRDVFFFGGRGGGELFFFFVVIFVCFKGVVFFSLRMFSIKVIMFGRLICVLFACLMIFRFDICFVVCLFLFGVLVSLGLHGVSFILGFA